ncbi:MAG: c-type cytochrome [Verrucomicrobia bacterium]|nr:c-type cytochrome [Verrucomicrobiota bacterium]
MNIQNPLANLEHRSFPDARLLAFDVRRWLSGVFPLLCLFVHSAFAQFPAPYNSETDTKFSLMPAAEAAAKMQLPPGFKATVFAAEPDVQNPIALAWDARGRLWVAENYTYAERALRYDMKLRDRIVILEDDDGDGRFDKRTVFTDDVQMLTSIEVGFGGVWAIALPHVVFIPDRNGDDKPDGPAEVVLDGFRPPQENHHNIANGLRFGPDGWLYGRCGASGAADVNVAGSTEKFPVRGGMWRYHPVRRVFEVITCGNTNPWGHDWNEHGELFYVNTVNGHLWHAVAGEHFVRAHTLDPNPRAYGLIDHHADHWHFDTSAEWSKSRDGVANAFGGGHSHIGAMVYHGDNWPVQYRGHLFTLNQHGRRANMDRLERNGSGYVGRHAPDVIVAEDKWFRGMEITYGPDGGVYVADWSDTGECHDATGVHRESGRIFKITHGTPQKQNFGDLTKLNSRELVKLHSHPNEWFVRQARLELASRAASGRGLDTVKEQLRVMVESEKSEVLRLRALWSLHAIGAADEKFLLARLRDGNEHVRAWAVRLLTDDWPLDTLTSQRPRSGDTPVAGSKNWSNEATRVSPLLARLARDDKSALVRLALATVLQRLPVNQRAELAAALVAHAEDASDHNLPLLIWFGLIPLGDGDPLALAKLSAKCELPTTRNFIARRLAEDIEKNPAPVNEVLKIASAKPEAFQADILAGLADGLTGWRKAKKPSVWDSFAKKLAGSANPSIADRVRDLSVLFGDGRALDAVKRIALDGRADMSARKSALLTLIENKPPDLRTICEQLLGTRFLNAVAVRGLAQFDDPAIGDKLAKSYRSFHQTERGAVMETLVSRPAFAKALLNEVATGKIPRTEVSAFHARQIRSFNDRALNEQLAKAWGELRDSAADKQQLITTLKKQLTPTTLAKADKSNGRAVFALLCANCHRLYGAGGEVGPDLTGTGRDNLDYLLDNIADPSAVVSADFRMTVVELKDGRVFNALITAKTDRTLTLKTMTETLTVERADLAKQQESTLSIMPEGLLEALTPEQQRDLLAYLMQMTQVPLPSAANSAR